MSRSTSPSLLVMGLALFSMFFGSGNLIFPLFMGQVAGEGWLLATGGFLLTAVFLPFAGVLAMVAFRGNYTEFFQLLGSSLGFVFTAILLTVWIPLGSAPRCVALSYASLEAYVAMPPLWLFSLFYTALLYGVVQNRHRMIQILGRYLTPALLLCLGGIVWNGWFLEAHPVERAASIDLFTMGMVEGYNTMDLIASFFFSASIIQMFVKDEKGGMGKVLKASALGIALLGSVYVGLIYLASSQGLALEGVPKEQLLAQLAKLCLGGSLGSVSAVAVLLACFTTSVALASVYADFMSQGILGCQQRHPGAVVATLLISFIISTFGLSGITALTSPALQICYPVLIVLILIHGLKKLGKRRGSKTLALH